MIFELWWHKQSKSSRWHNRMEVKHRRNYYLIYVKYKSRLPVLQMLFWKYILWCICLLKLVLQGCLCVGVWSNDVGKKELNLRGDEFH